MAAATVSSTVSSFARLSSSCGGTVNGVPVVTLPIPCAGFSKSATVVRCSSGGSQNNAQSDVSAVSRRFAIALLAGSAAVSSGVNEAQAAYGEAANIFASPKTQTGFTPYSGEGFNVDLPAKWNPSKEVEFPGQVLRYEDNFDATNNLSVSIVKTDKSSIKDYGSPEELLKSLSYLLGKQSYSGKTDSEGGFANNSVSTAALLDSDVKELNGKTYYGVNVLTRTADGDEGGKHQLIVATIDGGKLFILKAQAGDKRWFKGAKKFVEGVISSFNVL